MSAAVAVAAAIRRRQDWEFKILRSATGAFKRSDYLNKVLEEERQAGWVLVEKFDDGRIRLKRPARARDNDQSLGADPYRTWVGMSETKLTIFAVVMTLGVLGMIVALVAVVSNLR